MHALSVTAVVLAVAALFGPPTIKVTEVKGAPPTPNAVLLIESHHHTEEKDPQVSGRAITVRNGQRVTRDVALAKYGESGHFGVSKQWDSGTAWVLVFTIKQGEGGKHGTAESLVKVDATGRIMGIDNQVGRNARGETFPRAATEAEITAALTELGVRAER